MQWNVEGAEGSTGKEYVWPIEANSAAEAEEKARRKGMLVSRVTPAAQAAADHLSEMAGVPVGVPPVAQPIDYARHGGKSAAVPEYVGLKLGASILNVFGLLSYGVGALWLLLGIISVLSAGSAVSGGFVFGASLVPAFGCLVTGACLHTFSAGATALRDIARNSFR
jgi:hypothetical protein